MLDELRHEESDGVADAVADDVAEEGRDDDDPTPAAVGRRWQSNQRYQLVGLTESMTWKPLVK